MSNGKASDDRSVSRVMTGASLEQSLASTHPIFHKGMGAGSSEVYEQCHHSLVSWFALAYFIIYLLKVSSILPYLPISFNAAFAGFMFCIGPGLALYTLLCLFRKSQFSFLTLFVLSCSLGLTFNFLANVVIFIFEPSLTSVTEIYLVTVGVIYGGILAYWKRKGISLFQIILTVDRRILVFIVFGVLSIFYWLSLKTPTGLYVEELIVLRKIFENSSIAPTNIAFWKGEYTTYFFVPFYLFLSMSAQFLEIDVLEVAKEMWPVTTAMSILCLAAIVRHLSGQWVTVGVLVVIAMIHALFLSQPMSNELTVFAPFPDRYALASGVLIPLVLVHFLIHMDHSHINIPAFVGLVYLIVEMTFIHARETLFFIGIVLIYILIKSLDFKASKQELGRIFSLLCIVAVVLLVYRNVNLFLQPNLEDYVLRMRDDMWMHFWRGLNSHGWLSLFGIPEFHSTGAIDSFPYSHYFARASSFPGYEFVCAVICFLPLYALAVERSSLLLAPAVIAGLGLFSLFQGLHLLVGIAVGAPFIFNIFSVLFLFVAIVFADMVRMFAAMLLLPPQNKFSPMGKILFRMVCVVAVFQFLFMVFGAGYATGSLIFEILFYVATLVCVAIRARGLRQPERVMNDTDVPFPKPALKKNVRQWLFLGIPGRVVHTAEILAQRKKQTILAFSIGMVMAGMGLTTQLNASLGNEEIPSSLKIDASSGLGEVYNNISQLELFYHSRDHDWRLPPQVITFIREEIPPLQTWFGGHTLPVMIVSNQYAPLLSFSGKISIGFSANIFFLDRFFGPGTAFRQFKKDTHLPSDFTYFLNSGDDAEKLFTLLQEYGVEWILTRPEEKNMIEHLIKTRADIKKALELVFEAEGYKIFRFVFSSGTNGI